MLFIIPLLFIKPVGPSPNAALWPLSPFPSFVLSVCFLHNMEPTSWSETRGGRFFWAFILGPCSRKPFVMLPTWWCLNTLPRSWRNSWRSFRGFLNLNTKLSYLSPKAAISKHNLSPTQALKGLWWDWFRSDAAFQGFAHLFHPWFWGWCLVITGERAWEAERWQRHPLWATAASKTFFLGLQAVPPSSYAGTGTFRKKRHWLFQSKSEWGGCGRETSA